MALIKEIRQRTGLAIGVIAVGLIFFLVGGDILGPNSVILGQGKTTVGEIAGDKISYEEYIQKIEETKFSFQQNTGRTPTENDLFSIREQAWQALIVERVFSSQYDELGLSVTDEELIDMVQGKNIIAELRRELTNPETGEFDRQQLVSFLQSLETADPQQQQFWAQQEKLFADSRLRIKYDNMLGLSEYASAAEGKMQYKMANSIADVEHIHIPYYVVSDSSVSVSENELKSFLNKNKERFQVSANRDIEYVTFSLYPSSEDSAAIKSEINSLTVEFQTSNEDSVFVLRNSDVANSYQTISPGDPLPPSLLSNVENPEPGVVYGPFLTERSSYVSYKVSDQFEGSPRMRANHILLTTEGMDEGAKLEVKAESQRILDEVTASGNFALAAQQYGQDGTAQRGGDLGWFAKEDFIEEFADVVFATKTTGLINRIVETEYGYHIIEVTELSRTTTYKIAVLELDLIASDVTRNDVFRNADFFASGTTNAKEFRENAQKEGYQVLRANSINPSGRSLNNLDGAREIIRWSFNEASVGQVSTVFELDDSYVVALLAGKTDEGAANLNDANTRSQVSSEVRNEKKAAYIIDQIKGLQTLQAIKEKFPDSSLGSTADLRMNASVVPGIGFAPKAVGSIFGMKNTGVLSSPIVEDIGVILAKVNSITPASEIADFTRYQNEITTNASQRTSYMIMMAMEELAVVKDYRYKFF